jgi:prepilin-type N-terminal cleavage/methylation domain-containing protein
VAQIGALRRLLSVTCRTPLLVDTSAQRFDADGHQMRIAVAMASVPRRRGFSLIDMVVAVSLVGIMASFALPRFTHLANSARASEVVALSANLRNAAEAAHSQYLASGARLSAAMMEGKRIRLKNGYPDASGIGSAILDTDGFTASAGASSVTFAKSDAPSRDRCSVRYNAAAAANEAATITNLDISGC